MNEKHFFTDADKLDERHQDYITDKGSKADQTSYLTDQTITASPSLLDNPVAAKILAERDDEVYEAKLAEEAIRKGRMLEGAHHAKKSLARARGMDSEKDDLERTAEWDESNLGLDDRALKNILLSIDEAREKAKTPEAKQELAAHYLMMHGFTPAEIANFDFTK